MSIENIKNVNKIFNDPIYSEENLASKNVRKSDHIILCIVGFIPFIISAIWLANYIP